MATLSCSVMLGSQSGKGSSFSNLVIVLLKPWAAISYLGEAQLTPATSHTTLYFHLQCLDGQSRLERAARPDRANKCHIAAERSRCSARYLCCIQFFRHFSTSTGSKVGQNLEMSFPECLSNLPALLLLAVLWSFSLCP